MVRIYQMKNMKPLANLLYFDESITALTMSSKSNLICAASRSGRIAIWSIY